MSLGLSPTNLAFGQIEWYEPFIAVDIGDFIDRILLDEQQEIYAELERGDVMDVNNNGFACGWYVDANDGNENKQPFFFSPIDGGSAERLPLGSYDRGAAMGLSPNGSADSIVVGWIEEDTNGPEAAYWTWDDGWHLNFVYDTFTASEAQAITHDGFIAGFEYISGNPWIFVFNSSAKTMDFEATIKSEAYAVRDGEDWTLSGTMVVVGNLRKGFYKADGQAGEDLHDDLPEYSQNNDYDESIAYAMNTEDDVVGYAIETGIGGVYYDPVYWYYGTSSWESMIFDVENPDPVDAGMHDVSAPYNGWINIVGDYQVTGSPVRGVFFVRQKQGDDEESYWSYSLDDTGPSGHPTLALYPRDARAGAAPRSYTGNAVNDGFWIGGSYSPEPPAYTAPTDYRPCLWIPNDVNNNGIPDIIEILDTEVTSPSASLDKNDNWLLDWAENDQDEVEDTVENMRCGLHDPGFNGTDSGGGSHMLLVDDVQIVRHMATYQSIANPTNYERGLSDIVGKGLPDGSGPSNYCTQCEGFWDRMVEWGTSDGAEGDHQREIVISVRNPDSWNEDNDFIPFDEANYAHRTARLDLMRTFAFRFAHCIDYIQFGNEAFSGSGEFLDEPNGDLISTLSGTTFADTLDDVLYWVAEQAEAARIGSALAGRPLRLIGPAFPTGTLLGGALGEIHEGEEEEIDTDIERFAREINDTAGLVNDERMFFDMHLHYKTVENAEDAISNLVSSSSPWGQAGNVPDLRVVLEFGPKGDPEDQDGWLATHFGEVENYYNPNQSVDRTWEELIKDSALDQGWEAVQFEEPDGSFDLGDLLADLFDSDFVAVCYGPSTQRQADTENKYNIAALRADLIDESVYEKIDDSDFFTPLLTWTDSGGWLDVIGSYAIDPFAPHCSTCGECDGDLACPDCP